MTFSVANFWAAGKSHRVTRLIMSLTTAPALARIFGLAAALGLAAAAARAETADEVIAKARAYLGGDEALSAVRSVHFVGTMETQEMTADGPKPAQFHIEIIFQKPYEQLITKTSATVIDTIGLDDLEGWERIQDVTDRSRWRLVLLSADWVKKLRANTWENLNFFKGIEQRGGHADLLGPATVDGVSAIKIAFVHEPGITFSRYFDQATGRLLLTETDQGGRIREEGQIMVGNVRFPQKVTTISKVADAKGKLVDSPIVVTFDRITVNENFPASLFAVPVLSPPEEPPVSAPSAAAAPTITPPGANPPPAATR